MRTSLFLGVVLALGAGGALGPVDASAQNARAARAQTEGSMVLSGSIDIAPDGSVEGFTLKSSWGKSFRAPTLIQLHFLSQAIVAAPGVFGGTGFPPVPPTGT